MSTAKQGWAVYGGPPVPRHCLTRWQARFLAWRYARLGIRSSLYRYETGDHDLTLYARIDEHGRMRPIDKENTP
jgi:hypothetical protein